MLSIIDRIIICYFHRRSLQTNGILLSLFYFKIQVVEHHIFPTIFEFHFIHHKNKMFWEFISIILVITLIFHLNFQSIKYSLMLRFKCFKGN